MPDAFGPLLILVFIVLFSLFLLWRRYKQTSVHRSPKQTSIRRLIFISSALIILSGSVFFAICLLVPSSSPPHSPVSAGTGYFQTYYDTSSNEPGGIESHSLRDWSLLWKQPVGTGLNGCEPLGISNDSLFCYDFEQSYKLYALNPHNGTLLKQQDLSIFNISHLPISNTATPPPSLVDSLIYVCIGYSLHNNGFDQIYALHASDLTLAWTRKLDGPFFQETDYSSNLVSSVRRLSISGGRLFVLTDSDHVAAFDALSGFPIFQVNLSTKLNRTNNTYSLSSDLAIALSSLGNQFVYVSTPSSIVALNAANGALLWQIQRKMGSINLSTTFTGLYTWDLTPSAPINAQRRMVLDALDPATGKLIWSWAPPSSQSSSLVSFTAAEMAPSPIVGINLLYPVIGTTIYALRLRDARVIWHYDIWSSYPHANYDTGWQLTLRPPELTSDLLLLTGYDAGHPRGFIHLCFSNCAIQPPGTLQALNPFTGHVYWYQFNS